MTKPKYILDNQTTAIADFLQEHLANAKTFRLVSAYFSIYGYEILADVLDHVDRVRFLFGDPASVEDLDPSRKEPRSFNLTERGLVPNYVLKQKFLAKQCAEWIAKDTVSIRAVCQSNFLHGKMYLTHSSLGKSGIVGSSNFTARGLGRSHRPNVEINLAVTDPEILAELQHWFDELWNDKQRTQDVKRKVLDALQRLGGDHAPELVYFKTLYELFREDIEAQREGDTSPAYLSLHDSTIWNTLYEFQKDGVKNIIAKMQQLNGCILADGVGLGKTYTALAVIKYYELRNERVLVLCPRKLRENWLFYQASAGQIGNPFVRDRFSYTLLSHTDLSRDSGEAGVIDLANFNWSDYGLVIIDESHNFRNNDGKRYKRLLEEIIAQGTPTKVLMLSATPVNTSLTDLRNQIYLMTEGRDDSFQRILGIGNIRNLMVTAQRQFKEWEANQTANTHRDKSKLLESLGSDFFRLLGTVSISRSRRQIERFYAAEIERIGQFPAHEKPINRHPVTDRHCQLSYPDLVERIGQFSLSIYQPSAYLVDEKRKQELDTEKRKHNFNQSDRERFLIGMIRTNFLKRLESSAHALTLTLNRTIAKIDDLLKRIDQFQAGSVNNQQADVLPDEDEEDEEFFINRGRHPYRLQELDLSCWKEDLLTDRATLASLHEQVATVTPERDGKLYELQKDIRRKATLPNVDLEGNANRKMLIFTTFKDTATYLYANLTDLAGELDLKMAMVSGDVVDATTSKRSGFHDILNQFSPRARGRPVGQMDEIDLLIATDCISEGQNLQDCDLVLNYDIHWNPVRLIQRFGRIDRIGSRNSSVQMLNYWPTHDMDDYLQLRNRVQARMVLADISASGDEDPLSEADIQEELTFRDQQLLRLREEILDMDDLDDTPVMSDFTLDQFFTQLLRYLEQNREELEAMPQGVYANTHVSLGNAGGPVSNNIQPGVIFFLRQRNANLDHHQQLASPIHPFYIVYIYDNGNIRFGCGNAQQILSIFEATTAGKSVPLTRLCDQFDRQTDNGQRMGHYNNLLFRTISHITQAHTKTQGRNLGTLGRRDFLLPRVTEIPQQPSDFEVITWLVIHNTD